jgi:hypothetical protein
MLAALSLIFSAVGSISADAMDFKVITNSDGFSVLAGVGPIIPGDASRLQHGLERIPRDSRGLKELALSSPGGSVSEAFRMGEVIDKEKVLTFVLADTYCASACAAILFIDGKYHFILEGGMLGIHTCFHEKTRIAAPECNHEIALNAVAHGTAYGAVMGPMRSTSSDQAVWLSSKDADCWGLSRWPPDIRAQSAVAPCAVAAVRGESLPALTGTMPPRADDEVDCANAEALLETDPARAVAACRRMVDHDEAFAQFNLGYMYSHGQGVPQDYAEAARWYRKAADQGYTLAQYNFGFMYAQGQGVPQNYAEAAEWYRKAAEQGYVLAQYNLGLMYAHGQGVPQDYPEATYLFQKSADQGYADAQDNLGTMYANGLGVPKDYVQAYMWFSLAASAGNHKAPSKREIAKGFMTADQIAEAQRLAREWKPSTE